METRPQRTQWDRVWNNAQILQGCGCGGWSPCSHPEQNGQRRVGGVTAPKKGLCFLRVAGWVTSSRPVPWDSVTLLCSQAGGEGFSIPGCFPGGLDREWCNSVVGFLISGVSQGPQ